MFVILFFFALCYIVWSDITKRKIYNKTIAFLMILSTFLLFSGKVWVAYDLKDSIFSFLFFSVIFLIFYAINIMGAGDVKFLMVLSFLFGFNNFLFVFIISIFMMFFYVSIVWFFLIFGLEKFRLKLTFNDVGKKYIPYGACLSVASIAMLLKNEVGI